VASIIKYGLSLLPPFFGGLMAYDREAYTYGVRENVG
jgi:ornithine decarboxylase